LQPLASGSLSATRHSRHPSLVGVGVPSASFFAASVAAINRRTSRGALLSMAGAAAPTAVPADLAHPDAPLLHEQQHTPWMQQQRRRQQRLGALAGDPVALRSAACMAQQGSASAAIAGLITASGAQGPPAPAQHQIQHAGSSSLSSIAQLLQQQHGSLAKQLSTAGSLMKAGSWQQPQQYQFRVEVPHPPTLRCLPGCLGPWPLELPDQDTTPRTAGAATVTNSTEQVTTSSGDQQPSGINSNHSSSSSSSGSMNSTGIAATAAANAVLNKVLLLRCLLVYHLQTSLLYDAQVRHH